MKNSNHTTLTALFLVFTILSQCIGAAAQERDDIVGGASGDIAGGSSVFVFKNRKKPQERNAFRAVQVVRTVQARVKDRKDRVEQSKLISKVITFKPTPRPTPRPKDPKQLQKVEGAAVLARSANEYLKVNNLEEAENNFAGAAELDPENAEAKIGMAAVYAARGDAAYEKQDYARAVQFFEKANIYDGSNADVYASLGDSYDALKQPEKAIAAYETALRLKKELTTLNAPLGFLYATTKNFEKSADFLSQALAVAPEDTKLRDTYGFVLYKLNRNEDAKKALLKAVELNSKNAESYYYLGEVYDRLNDQEKAIAAYQKAVALNPKYKEAFFDLGAAHYNRGQYKEAAQSYDQAVRQQGDYLEARLNLADAYRQMADNGDKTGYGNAINQYQVVISLLARPQNTDDKTPNNFKPNEAEIFSKFGYSLGRNKQWSESINYLDKAVAKQPDAVNYTNLAGAYNNAGIAAIRENKLTVAQTNFSKGEAAAQEAVKLNENFPAAYLNLGNAQVNTGQYAEAKKSFQQALKLKKDWADALNNLGVVYGKMNDWEEASNAHRAAAGAEPNSVAAHFNLGFAAIKLGDKKTAERERDILLGLNAYRAKELDNLIRGASFGKNKKNK